MDHCMKLKPGILFPAMLMTSLFIIVPSIFAQSDGDALQLQTYLVESAADRPDVTDGMIAASANLDEWKSASARKIVCEETGGNTLTPSVLFSNDNDSLYIAVALPNDNNGANQGFFMYFDLDNDGVLDGTPSQPGEYAISSLKLDATQATFKEYGWDGTQWVENTIITPGLKEGFEDNGAGGTHVYNFEIQIPFLSSAPNAGQAYLKTAPGNEVGIMITLDLWAGYFYWQPAGTSLTNASAWGELLINTALASPRRFASLYAKSYTPTVTDGNITDDVNWKYSFDKTVVFTDFEGNKLSNCRILMKEAGGNIYFGARITDNVSNNGDYFQIYFDQGDNGGALNYILNPIASTRKDDAIRVAGNDALTDLYFDGFGWATDGTTNLTGAANFVTGAAWEFEMAKPLTTGDLNDLSITSGTMVGIIFRYYDADNSRNYWWSGTINTDTNKVDVSVNYNALGWAELVTGGPFVQPLYPEQNDIISGTYPFMLYAEDEDGVLDIDSADYRITDLNDNIFIDYSSSTRMTKVDNDSSGLWVTTFNSNTASTPDGDYNIVFRVKDDDGISVVAPVRIRIQNTGTVGGPTISNVSLTTGAVVAGAYRLTFEVSPSGSYSLVSDSIQIAIDGGTWTKVDSTPAVTGGTGMDSINTVALNDGVHTVRLRAKDNGNLTWGYSELIIFNVNNSGNSPTVVIDSVSGSSVKSGSVTVSFTATAGSNSTIDSCQISVDGLTWTRTTTNTSHTLNTTVLGDGTHLLQVRAFGSNNTTGYSRNVSIITANVPTVTITAPQADSVVSGTLVVLFTATPVAPATIASTQISVDGGTWRATSTTSTDTLNTQSLTDGSHTLQVRMTDNNGKTGTSAIVKFNIQNLPTVTITAPRADSVVSGTLVVQFTASAVAPATIASTQISVDGGTWRATSTTSTDTLNTQSLTDGSHTLQVRMTDNNGKTGTSAIVKFNIQNLPTVTIAAPRADSVISGTLVVQFTASAVAPATIASTQISVDGGTWRATSTTSTDTLNTQSLTDGSHTLQVRMTDNNGKTGTSAIVKFNIQNLPTVTITAPQADSVVSGTLVVLFTATPVAPATIASTQISVDGGAWRATSTGSADTLNTQNLTEGSHTIQVRATDNNGKTATSAVVKFNVQNNPTVTITAPQADSVVSGTLVVLFTATPVAPAAIASTQISVDGGTWRATSTGSTDTLDTRPLSEGSHTIQVRATDNNGKTGLSPVIKFNVRNAPSVVLHSPVADTTLSGTTTIRFTATPVAPATIIRREIWIDGGLMDTSSTDSSYAWNTLLRTDGQHTVQVRITDSNGKTARSELVLVTSFNTPIVRIVSPSDTNVISGIDTIRYIVTYAPGSSRDTTEIAFNGSGWRPTTDSLSYIWVSTDFLDGNHNVQVRATATNGKTGSSQIAAYKVSNVPQVTLLAPLGGEALKSVYTVRFAITPVSPATIARRMVSIDGSPWSDSLVDSASYHMSTIGWEEGTHSIQVRAIDSKGRSGYSSQRSFVVDNAPPIAADPKVEYPNNAVSAARNAAVLITVLAKDVLTGLRSDSAVVLRSERIDTAAAVVLIMRDDGQEGDKVANDNVYSVQVKVTSDTTGAIGYSITATDRLLNAVTLTSAIRLDNIPPELSPIALTPEPELISSSFEKRSYFDKLIMRGAYSDEGGSGLSRVMVAIKNDSAANVNNSPIDLSPKDSLFSRILHLVPGKNYLAFEAADNAGNTTVRRDTVTYIEPKATKVVTRDGGAIASPNGVAVTIPKDALLRGTEITITRVLPIDEPKPLSAAIKLLQVPHDFGPDGTSFRKPVRVTLSYTEADLDPDQNGVNDFDPSKFIIVFWDGSTWLSAGSASVDTVTKLVSVDVNHFTMFDIAQQETSAVEKLVTYWTHNPVKSSNGSYFNYELPAQGTVSLAIMDMAGDLVYQLIPKNTARATGTYSVGWRGQNVAERFAGAGLYVYLFTYKNSATGDNKIIRKPIGLLK